MPLCLLFTCLLSRKTYRGQGRPTGQRQYDANGHMCNRTCGRVLLKDCLKAPWTDNCSILTLTRQVHVPPFLRGNTDPQWSM